MLLTSIEKAEKYLDLAIKLQTLWNTLVEIVPFIFGSLGTAHRKFPTSSVK